MAVQAECAAFLRGVAAGFASAVAVPHHRVVVTVIASPPESTMPCPAAGRYNHVVEAETVTRRVIMGDAAAVFFALALEIVSAQGALAVRTAARGRAEVRFFDGETAARRELADAERFIMGDAAIWFCDERGASGDGEKSMACRACDYDLCMVCMADTVENDDDDDAHTAAHDHDTYPRPPPDVGSVACVHALSAMSSPPRSLANALRKLPCQGVRPPVSSVVGPQP